MTRGLYPVSDAKVCTSFTAIRTTLKHHDAHLNVTREVFSPVSSSLLNSPTRRRMLHLLTRSVLDLHLEDSGSSSELFPESRGPLEIPCENSQKKKRKL